MNEQKIVINRCYGGFGLSPKAIQRLAELQGKPCYFYRQEITNYGTHIERKLIPTDAEGAKDAFMWFAFTVPDASDMVLGGERWHEMTSDERAAFNQRWGDISLSDFRNDRANPLLVQVVEELGTEADKQPTAELKVVEIPAGVEWEIDEYDGMETIEEVHNSWS